ncbi:MAG: hypothetical protein GC161_15360 [Planctomycetaceae bacterium]|nr:hypothetical protein [Planctomycetaceae bacterium]
MSNELLERLKTPEVEWTSVQAPSALSVLAVQLPMELADSDAWLQIVRDGEVGRAIRARIGRDGVANFAPTWSGPADLLLGTDAWIGEPAELYVPDSTGYFDARFAVQVARLAIRVPDGSELPKNLLFVCLRPKSTHSVRIEVPGPDVVVGLVHDEVDVRLSAAEYRDLELTIRPGQQEIELQPGFRVEIRIEGVDAEILEDEGVMAWLHNGDQVEMLHLKSTSTAVILPEAGWWDVNLGKPFSWSEMNSASSRPAWVQELEGSTSLSGGWIANPPKWSTRIHVDEIDARVTLAPVWEEQ